MSRDFIKLHKYVNFRNISTELTPMHIKSISPNFGLCVACVLSLPPAADQTNRGFNVNAVLTDITYKVGKVRQVTCACDT